MDKGRMLRDCETVLVQVSGGPDMTLDEVQLLMEEFNRHVSDRTRILFGTAVDATLEGRVAVTEMSSIGDARPMPARARTPISRPERLAPKPVAAPIPAAPEPEPEEVEPERPVIQETVEAEVEESFELDGNLPIAEPEEEPVVEPEPVAPRVEKPRGLRAATQQSSLFGEEPAAPVERIAPPVPGRMLHRPFPPRPAPAPTPVPEVEPEPESTPVFEPEPEAAIPPVLPEPVPEPRMAPRPPTPPRRPVAAPPSRSPELIPAEETASYAPGKAPQQGVMEFEPVTRGRFEKSEPTIVDGQDLDVPTYLRRRVKLR